MTHRYHPELCGKPYEHDAWAMHFLGFLAAGNDRSMRDVIIDALISSRASWPLPEHAEDVLRTLLEERQDDCTPF